jgi:transcription termination factor Rho
MSVLDRATLDESTLADLHAIAAELSIDGYRRLRKGDLIDAIVTHQGGDEAPARRDPEPDTAADDDEGSAGRRRRGRRGGRGRSNGRSPGADGDEPEEADEAKPARSAKPAKTAAPAKEEEPEIVEGVVELLPNGSGFVRVSPPESSDGDVYVSAAQVKRCELVNGDRVTGPRRAPHRSRRWSGLTPSTGAPPRSSPIAGASTTWLRSSRPSALSWVRMTPRSRPSSSSRRSAVARA